ncbi:MAG TPA: hypothetical protein PJ986_21990, partial [Gammaproteobacteria bacterium]|nr:hypothetical protein [Gammaproteobacteria bacterium]
MAEKGCAARSREQRRPAQNRVAIDGAKRRSMAFRDRAHAVAGHGLIPAEDHRVRDGRIALKGMGSGGEGLQAGLGAAEDEGVHV